VGKCILTGSMEQRYFKVDGSMEKKWDTVIPADLKRLFVRQMSRWSQKGQGKYTLSDVMFTKCMCLCQLLCREQDQ